MSQRGLNTFHTLKQQARSCAFLSPSRCLEGPERPHFFSREPILFNGGCKQRANRAAVWRPKVVFGISDSTKLI